MKRNASLDCIKVIATGLIICYHFQQVLGVSFDKVNFYNGQFSFGYLVELFFIISGICAFPWIEKIETVWNFKSFYSKRMLRLLPLTAISVVVASLESVVYYYVKKTWWFDQPFSMSGALFACLGIQTGWASNNPMINNPIWYISVLLLCYAIMYFVTWLAKRIEVSPYYFYMGLILVGIGIRSYEINLPFLNTYSARGYMSFFAGILYMKIANHLDLKKWWIQIAAAIVFLGQVGLIYKGMTWNMGLDVVFILWPSLLILFHSRWVKRIIQENIWSKWAEISFSVYIWHCILLIGYLFMPREDAGWLYSGWGLFFTIVILQVVGILSNQFIEKPLYNFLKRECL